MAITAITQDFVVSSGLVVQGTTPVTTSTVVAGALSAKSGVAIAKNIVVGSTATVYGATQLFNTLDVSGNTTLDSQLAVIGASTLSNTLYVANTGTFNSDLVVKNNTTITGTLFVDKATTLNNTLYVNNTGTFNTDLGVGGTTSLGTDSPNYLKIYGGDASKYSIIQSEGEASTGLLLGSGGTGNITFNIGTSTNIGNSTGFAVTQGGINYLTAKGNSAGNPVIVGADGADTDININLTPKGSGIVKVDSTVATSSGNTGALQVAGGAGVAGGLFVAGATTVSNTLDVSNVVTIKDTTVAATAGGGSGALVVKGGEYIEKNLIVNGSDSNTATLASNALYVAGGVGINNGLVVQGTAVFQNDVFFNGPATYVYSTNTIYTDNLIELHTSGTSVASVWTFDDQKDIGFRFHYFEPGPGDLNAALVLAADTHLFEFYRNGTETNGSFVSHEYAGIKAATLNLQATTTSTNTGTGALTVEGGVGIGGDVNIQGKMTAGNVQVNSLTPSGIIFSDDQGNLTNVGVLTYNTTTAILTGYVTTATNLYAGKTGEIPIQSAGGKTAFIEAGTTDNQVLTWHSGSNTATWVAATSGMAGYALYSGTATNIAGGAQYDIPFQSATSSTTFDTGVFTYNDTTKALYVDNIQIWGTTGGPSETALQIVDGNASGIQLYSALSARISYNDDNFVTVDTSGVTLTTADDAYSLVLDYTGNLTLGGNTGSGYFTAPYIRSGNLSTTNGDRWTK
jgi:predicted acyltransferase (DUF342 family)